AQLVRLAWLLYRSSPIPDQARASGQEHQVSVRSFWGLGRPWPDLALRRMKAPNLFGVPGDAGDMLDDLAARPRLTPWSVEGLLVEAAQPQRVQLAQPA